MLDVVLYRLCQQVACQRGYDPRTRHISGEKLRFAARVPNVRSAAMLAFHPKLCSCAWVSLNRHITLDAKSKVAGLSQSFVDSLAAAFAPKAYAVA